ncbi:Dual specificity protein phosphatase 8 [Heterocephalus glaber]|uniref:protein-tyrosine-phosphatase n=1 Tax=Heterocephalus glaber TaxID=10181 RepID=G5C8K8_HETGA|nr:Dual specificity protein phosphatase 8 [Heterocephalus glaber]
MAGDRLPRKVMDARKLASLLRGGPGGPLVIDSGSFVEYNSWHVLSSVEAAEPQDVVVYDQSTRDASVLAADSFLSILLSKLDGCFDSVAILTVGGGGPWPTVLGAVGMQAEHVPMAPVDPAQRTGGDTPGLAEKREDLMTQNGISYVLNASNSCPKPDFICESRFMRIPINDNYCEKLLPWLDKSVEFIDKAKLSSCQVIVHCLAGISRSATIAIAYIMKTMGMSSDDAYRYCVRSQAPASVHLRHLADSQFKRRSCQMEFEEGMAEGHARGEELTALGKQASFSGSVEVIQVS